MCPLQTVNAHQNLQHNPTMFSKRILNHFVPHLVKAMPTVTEEATLKFKHTAYHTPISLVCTTEICTGPRREHETLML
jgi:hypothetical protein